MGRGIVIALAISVMLNVFAIGFLSGRVISGGDRSPPPVANELGAGHPMAAFRMASRLPDEARRSFRRELRENLPTVRQAHRKLRDKRRAYADALASDPWDPDSIRQAQADMRAAQDERQQILDAALLKAFGVLEEDDRAILLSAMRENAERRGRRPGNDRRRPPPPQERS